MYIKVTEGGPIPNLYKHLLNSTQREATYNVIAQLQYGDLWRAAGTLRDNGTMRVDMQGHIAGDPIKYNIQVQVNNVNGSSTVAHAIFSAEIIPIDPENQQGVVKRVISALNQSFDKRSSYTVVVQKTKFS